MFDLATLLLVMMSALLFYSTSTHFSYSIPQKVIQSRKIRFILAAACLVSAVVVMSYRVDVVTAIVAVLVYMMTLIPLLVLTLSVYPKSWIGWISAAVIIMIVNIFCYAG